MRREIELAFYDFLEIYATKETLVTSSMAVHDGDYQERVKIIKIV